VYTGVTIYVVTSHVAFLYVPLCVRRTAHAEDTHHRAYSRYISDRGPPSVGWAHPAHRRSVSSAPRNSNPPPASSYSSRAFATLLLSSRSRSTFRSTCPGMRASWFSLIS